MFDKHELAMIDRALERLISTMAGSRFIGEEDPHFAKCEALRAKVVELKKGENGR